MTEENRRKNSYFYYVTAVLLIVISVVSFIVFLLHGETTYSNTNGSVDLSSYIICESDKIAYPFYVDTDAIGTNLKINATFDADDLKTISLVYQINYKEQGLVENGLTQMHIAMNKAFEKYSLQPDSFSATYTAFETTAQLGLYAEKKEINAVRARFFMLDGLNSEYSSGNVTKLYNNKGIDCLINN